MSSKTSPAFTSAIHPPVGTLIDGGSLELVEVLGVGGYGVVYRAVDARHPSGPKSYAVKCLVASGHQTPRQKQIHIREIALHQLASAHHGVVTLHRTVEQHNHTYIIMDYATDHDLFTQILHSCRYLGDDGLIKDIFLQLLDAVEYCHSLHIYHRDLKPENILCYDDGLRVAITDFGLATTAEYSDEFRTGSVYHMSPECQGGEFAPTGNYCPRFNDIWSLGIILLNLATGRNPWKSATANDPTFQAYLRDPMGFLPSVLPISAEVNDILVRMLEVDWRERATLREVRYAIEDITTFYSDGAVFEGSMARCPWESGMDIDSASSGTNPDECSVSPPSPPPHAHPHGPAVDSELTSHWSKDSSSDIIFANRSLAQESSYGGPWTAYSSSGATWAFESPISTDPDRHRFQMDMFSGTKTANTTPASTAPPTPNSLDLTFGSRLNPAKKMNLNKADLRSSLIINTNIPRPRIYEGDNSIITSSPGTSMMQTAIEYDPYSSMFFLNSPVSPGKGLIVMPDMTGLVSPQEDREMVSPSIWTNSTATELSRSAYSDFSVSSSINDDDTNDDYHIDFTNTPEPVWTPFQYQPQKVECPMPPLTQPSQPSPSMSSTMTDVLPHYSRSRLAASGQKKRRHDSTPSPFPYLRGNGVGKRRGNRASAPTSDSALARRPPSPSLSETLNRLAHKLFPPRAQTPPPATKTTAPASATSTPTPTPRQLNVNGGNAGASTTNVGGAVRRQGGYFEAHPFAAPYSPTSDAATGVWCVGPPNTVNTARAGNNAGGASLVRRGPFGVTPKAAATLVAAVQERTAPTTSPIRYLRSTKHWFLPGRFIRASAGVN